MVPESLVRRRRQKLLDSFSGKSNAEIFTTIYRNYLWGRKKGSFDYYSGDGSHHPKVVDDYINVVSKFLGNLYPLPVVIDIGCGDFSIGSHLSKFAKVYIACDVVPEVIAANQNRYRFSNVVFKVLDATTQKIPQGDVVILRQVLQHLSNSDIANILKRIQGNFKYLIFTDHQSSEKNWIPNLDKLTGPNIRADMGSGLDLTLDPFNMETLESKLVHDVEVEDGFIRTFIYRLE